LLLVIAVVDSRSLSGEFTAVCLAILSTNSYLGVSTKVDSQLAKLICTSKDHPAFQSPVVLLSGLLRRSLAVLSALQFRSLLSLPEALLKKRAFAYLLDAKWKGSTAGGEVNGFKMKEAFTILLRYQMSMAERTVGVSRGLDNYTYGTSEGLQLMGLRN
jgi:hypothetical protein